MIDRTDELASVAFHAAMADDWHGAVDTCQAINDEADMQDALLLWIDTFAHYYAQAAGPNLPSHGSAVELTFRAAETGEVTDADGAAPEYAWAGRLIAARIAMDKPTFEALINALPDDPATAGRHIIAVLRAVALTLTKLHTDSDYARLVRDKNRAICGCPWHQLSDRERRGRG